MVRQVPVLGVLQIVQGALESLLGILLTVMGPMMGTILKNSPQQPEMPAAMPAFMAGAYVVIGLGMLAVGALRVTTGVMHLSYKGRTLGFVSLGLGLASLFTCYCFPTALGLLIYGLIVLLNADVARAFEMRTQGSSPEQIKAAFP